MVCVDGRAVQWWNDLDCGQEAEVLRKAHVRFVLKKIWYSTILNKPNDHSRRTWRLDIGLVPGLSFAPNHPLQILLFSKVPSSFPSVEKNWDDECSSGVA